MSFFPSPARRQRSIIPGTLSACERRLLKDAPRRDAPAPRPNAPAWRDRGPAASPTHLTSPHPAQYWAVGHRDDPPSLTKGIAMARTGLPLAATLCLALPPLLADGPPPPAANPWWQRGADTWYYKDDWKALAVTPVKGGREPAVVKTIKLDTPARSGWILIWGDRGYRLLVNDRLVGASVDGGLIDDCDLTKLVVGRRDVAIRIDGRKVAAEGEVVDASGERHPFATGADWQGAHGGGVRTEKLRPGPSRGAYHRSHNARLTAYNAEQRAKLSVAKGFARIQRLGEQGVFLLRRHRTPAEVLRFDPDVPWRKAEAVALPLLARARALLEEQASPTLKAGRLPEALDAARQAAALLSAAEAAVSTTLDLYLAEREARHVRNVSHLLGATGDPGCETAHLAALAGRARDALSREDWSSAAKAVLRLRRAAGAVRGRLERRAEQVGGVGDLDEFPEDRFAWLNARGLMDNDPADWPFTMLPSWRACIDLAGLWDFRIDPNHVGEKASWHSVPLDAAWRAIRVPDAWERHGVVRDVRAAPGAPFGKAVTGCNKPYNGFAWYRKRLLVPAAWRGQKLRLTLGGVSNWARLFVNGRDVGAYHRQADRRVRTPGGIDIPPEAVRFGRPNCLALLVYNYDNFGGITGGPVAIHQAGTGPGGRYTPGPLYYAREYHHGRWAEVHRQTFVFGAMAPGAIIQADRPVLDLWGWQAKGHRPPTRLGFDAGEGKGMAAIPLAGPADLLAKGAPADGWLLLGGSQRDVVLVPGGKLTALRWGPCPQGGMMLTLTFGGREARAGVVCLPAGAAAGAADARFWARTLRQYPISCSEIVVRHPAAATDRGAVPQICKLRYEYLPLLRREQRADKIAPVPMLASFALEHHFPGLDVRGAKTTGYRSPYAAYRVVEGTDTLVYTAPAVDRSKVMKGVGELFAKKRERDNHHAWGDEAAMFRRMAGWGFDHCRYAFAWHHDWDLPLCRSMAGPILPDNEAVWRRLDEVTRKCNDAGMQMMLTWFSDTGSRRWKDNPAERRNCYELWRRIARRYKDHPRWAISYDFFNEPAQMNTAHYNRVMKELTKIVRSEDRKHRIVWESGDGWAQPHWCLWMEPVDDDNVLYSFHHYGKHWGYAYDEYYPGYQATRERTQIDPWLEAILFGLKHNVPTHCGEFGLSMIQPAGDGEQWLDDYLALFERFGIGWNWWNYSGRDVYRTGLIARDRVSPYVPILTKWCRRSGWGRARREAARMSLRQCGLAEAPTRGTIIHDGSPRWRAQGWRRHVGSRTWERPDEARTVDGRTRHAVPGGGVGGPGAGNPKR